MGRHEVGKHLLSADTVRDVTIRFGRADLVGGRLSEKNPVDRRKIPAVDNRDGRPANGSEPSGYSNRLAGHKRGYGLRPKLHDAALGRNPGALHAERTPHAPKNFRDIHGSARLVHANGLAGRRRLQIGFDNPRGRTCRVVRQHNRQIATRQVQHDSIDDVANGLRRGVAGAAGRNRLRLARRRVPALQRGNGVGVGVLHVELCFDAHRGNHRVNRNANRARRRRLERRDTFGRTVHGLYRRGHGVNLRGNFYRRSQAQCLTRKLRIRAGIKKIPRCKICAGGNFFCPIKF